MTSIGPAVHLLSNVREKLSPKNKFFEILFSCAQQILHEKLCIKLLKKKSESSQTYFAFFSKTDFSYKSHDCAKDNPPLTSSERAEIFTTDTLGVGPEVKSAVFNLDLSIQIYRGLKDETLSWPSTFRSFFVIEKEESEIFENAQNYL